MSDGTSSPFTHSRKKNALSVKRGQTSICLTHYFRTLPLRRVHDSQKRCNPINFPSARLCWSNRFATKTRHFSLTRIKYSCNSLAAPVSRPPRTSHNVACFAIRQKEGSRAFDAPRRRPSRRKKTHHVPESGHFEGHPPDPGFSRPEVLPILHEHGPRLDAASNFDVKLHQAATGDAKQ